MQSTTLTTSSKRIREPGQNEPIRTKSMREGIGPGRRGSRFAEESRNSLKTLPNVDREGQVK